MIEKAADALGIKHYRIAMMQEGYDQPIALLGSERFWTRKATVRAIEGRAIQHPTSLAPLRVSPRMTANRVW